MTQLGSLELQRSLTPFKAELSLLPNGYFPIMLQTVIIPKIAGDLPGLHLKEVRNLPFLQGLSLADPNFDHRGRIDLLFESDIIDDIVLPGRQSSDNCNSMPGRLCSAGLLEENAILSHVYQMFINICSRPHY